jgi:hypothetical protein
MQFAQQQHHQGQDSLGHTLLVMRFPNFLFHQWAVAPPKRWSQKLFGQALKRPLEQIDCL